MANTKDGLCPDDQTRDRTVLQVLLSDRTHSAWSVEEIARTLSIEPVEASDAVRALYEAGLVHRFGEFAFPTLAARSAERLSI